MTQNEMPYYSSKIRETAKKMGEEEGEAKPMVSNGAKTGQEGRL